MRFEQIERTLRESIDYMVRYQWKETRNIVNKAVAKVTRPLQLKDLFFVNVGGTEHEIYRPKMTELEKEALRLTDLNRAESMEGKKLDSVAGSRLEKQLTEENKSIQSIKSSFKTPNVIITDYKF